jgi:CRISPR/Cas system-associated exonuclease Cas4 (RecB family)
VGGEPVANEGRVVILLAIGLVVFALALLVGASRIGMATGVRIGTPIMASDVGVEPSVVLEAPASRLRGRPDYLLRERGRGRIYPVEVKPTRESTTLFETDLLQLAAYMLLTESTYGREFAGYGVVRYRSTEFRVALTRDLRRRCFAAAAGVRAARRAADVHRSHRVPARCGGCAVRGRCAEELHPL